MSSRSGFTNQQERTSQHAAAVEMGNVLNQPTEDNCVTEDPEQFARLMLRSALIWIAENTPEVDLLDEHGVGDPVAAQDWLESRRKFLQLEKEVKAFVTQCWGSFKLVGGGVGSLAPTLGRKYMARRNGGGKAKKYAFFGCGKQSVLNRFVDGQGKFEI